MTTHRFGKKIYTIWGNENAKLAHDEVLFNSDQVIVIKFRMLITDALFNDVEKCAPSISHLKDTTFEYIHKSNGIYYYIGQIDRLKIIKIACGVAEIEIVVLKHNQGSIESSWGNIGKYYPCKTKNDICNMRKWPIIGEQKINKVILHIL
jgi:hypothetical protein